MTTKKRFLVIGAGAVGGAFAAALHRSGHDVTVTARGEHLVRLQQDGLKLRGVWGEYDACVTALETVADDAQFDLVILAVKAQDAPEAFATNRLLLDEAALLVVQNGLESVHATKASLPQAKIAGGLAGLATSMLTPGIIEVTNLVTTYIGNDDDPVFARQVCDLIADSIPVEFLENFTGALWTKLVVNCVNAVPAITNLSMQELLDTGLTTYIGLSMQEGIRVALAAGIRFADLMGLTHDELVNFEQSGYEGAHTLPEKLIFSMGDVPNLGSTLQSLRRGRPTEIDQLNGAIVAAGIGNNIPTPINNAIVDLVHLATKNGFYSVTETRHILEAAFEEQL